jgi:hypothetical protein
MRAALDAGRSHVAIRWYERLRVALLREVGARPGAETRALYDACTAGARLGEPVFGVRELELAAAMAELQRAEAGETRALLVRGSTGIGKSALRREIAQRASDDGWRVVTVSCTAAGPPYGPIGAAIEQLLVHGRASLDALPERTRSILAELSPPAGPAPPLRGALTRHQVVAALRRALALPGGTAPTLLCVEDAHPPTRLAPTCCTSSSPAAPGHCWLCWPTARSGCERACRTASPSSRAATAHACCSSARWRRARSHSSSRTLCLPRRPPRR